MSEIEDEPCPQCGTMSAKLDVEGRCAACGKCWKCGSAADAISIDFEPDEDDPVRTEIKLGESVRFVKPICPQCGSVRETAALRETEQRLQAKWN